MSISQTVYNFDQIIEHGPLGVEQLGGYIVVVDLRIIVEQLETDLLELLEPKRHAQHRLTVHALRRIDLVGTVVSFRGIVRHAVHDPHGRCPVEQDHAFRVASYHCDFVGLIVVEYIAEIVLATGGVKWRYG